MIEAIERGGYLPQTIGFWVNPSLYDKKGEDRVQSLKNDYPVDVTMLIPTFPGYEGSPLEDHPSYVWGGSVQSSSSAALDARQLIADWAELDAFIENMPEATFPPLMQAAAQTAKEDLTGRYRLCHFWYFLYERLWSFRGMENALCDLLMNRGEVDRLLGTLCDFYIGVIDRTQREIGCEGVYVTDDLGTQQSLMFSPETFREVFLPHYRRVIDFCHQKKLHFWLHSCGNIESILPDLIDSGVDVLHPIQKFAMDEAEIAKKYAGKICFMCGMDVQDAMPFGTPEDVRKEVKRLVQTFKANNGRMIFSLGNGTTPDIPVENLCALYDEVYKLRNY